MYEKLDWLDAIEQGTMQQAFANLRWAPGDEPNGMEYASLACEIMSPDLYARAIPKDLPNMASGGDPVLLYSFARKRANSQQPTAKAPNPGIGIKLGLMCARL